MVLVSSGGALTENAGRTNNGGLETVDETAAVDEVEEATPNAVD